MTHTESQELELWNFATSNVTQRMYLHIHSEAILVWWGHPASTHTTDHKRLEEMIDEATDRPQG